MSDEEDARITLKDLVAPELRACTARVEALERAAAACGEYVEATDSSWLSDLEKRIMAEPDRDVVDLLLTHVDTMTALMLHRRISHLESL